MSERWNRSVIEHEPHHTNADIRMVGERFGRNSCGSFLIVFSAVLWQRMLITLSLGVAVGQTTRRICNPCVIRIIRARRRRRTDGGARRLFHQVRSVPLLAVHRSDDLDVLILVFILAWPGILLCSVETDARGRKRLVYALRDGAGANR